MLGGGARLVLGSCVGFKTKRQLGPGAWRQRRRWALRPILPPVGATLALGGRVFLSLPGQGRGLLGLPRSVAPTERSAPRGVEGRDPLWRRPWVSLSSSGPAVGVTPNSSTRQAEGGRSVGFLAAQGGAGGLCPQALAGEESKAAGRVSLAGLPVGKLFQPGALSQGQSAQGRAKRRTPEDPVVQAGLQSFRPH